MLAQELIPLSAKINVEMNTRDMNNFVNSFSHEFKTNRSNIWLSHITDIEHDTSIGLPRQ